MQLLEPPMGDSYFCEVACVADKDEELIRKLPDVGLYCQSSIR